nr:hypothetical protein CFP56_53680 [Quercus suber]
MFDQAPSERRCKFDTASSRCRPYFEISVDAEVPQLHVVSGDSIRLRSLLLLRRYSDDRMEWAVRGASGPCASLLMIWSITVCLRTLMAPDIGSYSQACHSRVRSHDIRPRRMTKNPHPFVCTIWPYIRQVWRCPVHQGRPPVPTLLV